MVKIVTLVAALFATTTATGVDLVNKAGTAPSWRAGGLKQEVTTFNRQPIEIAMDVNGELSKQCITQAMNRYKESELLHWVAANYSGCMARKYAAINQKRAAEAQLVDAWGAL